MRTVIGSGARRDGRGPALMMAAFALGLLCPADLFAAAPVAALMGGVVGQGQYGTVKGRLIWGGDRIPPVKVLEDKGKAQKDPNVCAKDRPIMARDLVVDPETKGVSYGFAYIVRPKGSNPEAAKELVARKPTVEIDQVNCEFVPYVTPVYQEQALVVKATDPGINHNVRLSGFNNGVNQTVAPGGQLQLKLVPERLPIKVQCDIHPWMTAYVMVFDHPFFATTGKDGSFQIEGVPAGAQNIVVWQERVGFATQGGSKGMPVTVKAGEVVDIGEIKVDSQKALK